MRSRLRQVSISVANCVPVIARPGAMDSMRLACFSKSPDGLATCAFPGEAPSVLGEDGNARFEQRTASWGLESLGASGPVLPADLNCPDPAMRCATEDSHASLHHTPRNTGCCRFSACRRCGGNWVFGLEPIHHALDAVDVAKGDIALPAQSCRPIDMGDVVVGGGIDATERLEKDSVVT